MFKNINNFFSIEDKSYKKYQKSKINQEIRIEEYKSVMM